jgi:RNA polymerase sigma-70 factor, ECF subfamily
LLADIQSAGFEETILPHLDAAYNLARWLVRNGTDAEDLVQEACLRAWRSFAGFRGGDGRSWLLTIVRNTCFTWLRENRRQGLAVEFNEDLHSEDVEVPEAERLLAETSSRETLEKALQELPVEFREAIVLRELEGLSYKEISEIASVPVGTVMSRLARARERLQICLAPAGAKGGVKCTAKKPGA